MSRSACVSTLMMLLLVRVRRRARPLAIVVCFCHFRNSAQKSFWLGGRDSGVMGLIVWYRMVVWFEMSDGGRVDVVRKTDCELDTD